MALCTSTCTLKMAPSRNTSKDRDEYEYLHTRPEYEHLHQASPEYDHVRKFNEHEHLHICNEYKHLHRHGNGYEDLRKFTEYEHLHGKCNEHEMPSIEALSQNPNTNKNLCTRFEVLNTTENECQGAPARGVHVCLSLKCNTNEH